MMPSVKLRENDNRHASTEKRAQNSRSAPRACAIARRYVEALCHARSRAARQLALLAGASAAWLWPLAWVAPVPWLVLIRRRELAGRRPYRHAVVGRLYLLARRCTGCACRIPSTSLGWLALSGYLGCYLPVFVALARVAVHELRISSIIAAARDLGRLGAGASRIC